MTRADKKLDDAAKSELSSRELDVLKLICDGLRDKELGTRLGISARTVESHRRRIGQKTGAKSIALLVRWAIRRKLIKP